MITIHGYLRSMFDISVNTSFHFLSLFIVCMRRTWIPEHLRECIGIMMTARSPALVSKGYVVHPLGQANWVTNAKFTVMIWYDSVSQGTIELFGMVINQYWILQYSVFTGIYDNFAKKYHTNTARQVHTKWRELVAASHHRFTRLSILFFEPQQF